MVGRRLVLRLPETAGEQMRADRRVPLGDVTYYEKLAVDQRKNFEEWTAYYAKAWAAPPGDSNHSLEVCPRNNVLISRDPLGHADERSRPLA